MKQQVLSGFYWEIEEIETHKAQKMHKEGKLQVKKVGVQ